MVEQPVQYPAQEQHNSTTESFLVCPCTYSVQTRYVRVCKEYVLVCTNMYQSTANLWIEGTSGIRVFASCCARLNPVKQASVLRLYIQECTGTHQVHTSIYWSVSSTYLYILSICWYIWVCTNTYQNVLSTYLYVPFCIKYILVHPQYILEQRCSCLFIQGTTWYIPCYSMVLL